MEELVEEFLEYLEIEKGCSPGTIREYRHYLTRFSHWLREAAPQARPEDLDLELVRKYRLHLAHLEGRDGAPLKRATQAYHIVALRAFLRYLVVRRDLATLSPDKVELPKTGSRLVRFLDGEQVELLLAAPNVSTPVGLRDRVIMETLFSTGLRVSELVKLNRDEISLERQEFGVVGKGAKPRVVFLSAEATEWLRSYLASRRDGFKPLFIRYAGRTDFARDGEGMRLSARSVERIVEKYARRCGLPVKVSPHTLRHSFATDLLRGGADLRSVQEMLGHESIRTTQVYTHVTDRQLREVHRAFHSRTRPTVPDPSPPTAP